MMTIQDKLIGFIGFGDLGKQIAWMMETSGYNPLRFRYFDDFYSHANSYRFNDFKKKEFSELNFIVSIGYKHLELKKRIIDQLICENRRVLTFIHPTSYVNPSAKIGFGVIIYPMCNIDKDVIIEDGILLNNSVTVSHNCILGASGYYSPGVILSGNVTAGSCVFIGSGSTISNNLRIGKNCQIGIGSVITSDLPDNCSVIGNPARIIDHKLKII